MSDIVFNTDDVDINADNAQKQDVTVTDLDNVKTEANTEIASQSNDDDKTKVTEENSDDSSKESVLNSGDKVEIDGAVYVISNNGDLVDDKGNVFKKASEVKEFIESNNIVNENELNISNIINKLDVNITDDDGKPIEFANTPEGIAEYVNTVIDLKSDEIKNEAISDFFENNPNVKLFADYIAITGSAKGFGDIPDRSGIVLNEKNETQLANVILMAAKEFNNPMINDTYIEYLKSTDKLYEVAKEQLAAMIEHDKQVKTEIENRAAEQRKQADEASKAYWAAVRNIVNDGVVNGQKLPDTFKKEVNGKVITYSKGDFFDYIYRRDRNGMTRYEKDMQNQNQNDAMHDAIMKAWLTYTNNDYSIFIKTAKNEDAVKTLKLTASKNNKSAIRVIRNNNGKTNNDDILLN